MNITKLTDSELGYLKGFFMGDGYKYHDKKGRKYYVEFYTHSIRDKKISKFLIILTKKLKLNPNIYKDKRFYCKRIRITNKEFFNLFDKDFIKMNLKNGEIIGFISGFIDAEGYVNNKKRFIQVVNTNHQVLEFIKNELAKMRVSSSISNKWASKKSRKQAYNLYISVTFKNIPHLAFKPAGWSSLECSPGP